MSEIQPQINNLAKFFFNLLFGEFLGLIINQIKSDMLMQGQKNLENSFLEFPLLRDGEVLFPTKLNENKKKLFIRILNNPNYFFFVNQKKGFKDQQIWTNRFCIPYLFNKLDSKILNLSVEADISLSNSEIINLNGFTQDNITEEEISKIITLYSLQF
jgi:hypothetical protein